MKTSNMLLIGALGGLALVLLKGKTLGSIAGIGGGGGNSPIVNGTVPDVKTNTNSSGVLNSGNFLAAPTIPTYNPVPSTYTALTPPDIDIYADIRNLPNYGFTPNRAAQGLIFPEDWNQG